MLGGALQAAMRMSPELPVSHGARRLRAPGKSAISLLWGLSALAWLGAPAAAADGCPGSDTPIATDRPDVTNSSVVVPSGSLQSENGVNLTARDGAQILDATNSRLRWGVAPCFELLVDLPNYFAALRGHAISGFSNVAPAVKWQLGPLPADVNLSLTAGIGLPTGTPGIAGPGVQPYLQVPWSRELGGGWGISGMVTAFFFPSDPINHLTTESTFVIEKAVNSGADVFLEYVGYYPEHGPSRLLLNSGAVYRVTPTQQIDIHLGFGLNRDAPALVFGVGYSFRIDGVK
jgi:Putative MetA-pathway of phenol degradation